MKKLTLDASMLRWILIGAIALLVAGGIAGTWFVHNMLNEQVSNTARVRAEAQNSSQDLTQAQALGAYLEKNQSDAEKTARVVAETTTFKYQDNIIQDITRYANEANLTVLGFDFPSSIRATKSANGLTSIKAIVTLKNPVHHQNYLKFLKLIEQNLTKMQITDITLTPDKANPVYINNPTVGLEVYSK